MSSNSNRIVAVLIWLGVSVILIASLAKLIGYFNTGADKKSMLNITPEQLIKHQPKIEWLPDQIVDARVINDYLRKDIETAYSQAWHILNQAMRNSNTSHLQDYYADEILERIIYELTDSSDFIKEQVDLQHTIQINHFALDNQLVAFRDSGVEVIKRIYKENDLISSHKSVFDFEVVMTLDDGRWRIRHMLRSSADVKDSAVSKLNRFDDLLDAIQNIKGVNYYPSNTPWFEFWPNYDEDIVKEDLYKAKELGFNTVRTFLQYGVFGEAHVSNEMLLKLEKFLDALSENNQKAVITLFDFPKSYELEEYTSTDRHLESILTRFESHPAILAWDLKNEPDLDFEIHGKQKVLDWLKFIADRAKMYDTNHPITIGWALPQNANNLASELDIVSFHYYDEPDNFSKSIGALKSEVGIKPLLLSEFGASSSRNIFNLFLQGESSQKATLSKLLVDAKKEKIGFLCWALFDFEKAPTEVFGRKPWIKLSQKKFGILKSDGSEKAVTSLFQE